MEWSNLDVYLDVWIESWFPAWPQSSSQEDHLPPASAYVSQVLMLYGNWLSHSQFIDFLLSLSEQEGGYLTKLWI